MNAKTVAVLSFTGNVGKTTLAVHLLAPRMPGAKVLSIETLNNDGQNDGVDAEKMRAAKFGEIQREILLHDGPVIVDIGASNVETFMKQLVAFSGAQVDFDLFVIPVLKDRKVQIDTVNTIEALAKLGVTRDRIRVVFNRLDVEDDPEAEFPALFGFHDAQQLFTLFPVLVVRANEVYDRLKNQKRTLSAAMADKTDWRAAVRASKTDQDKENAIAMMQIVQLAGSAHANLDHVFANLVPAPTPPTPSQKKAAAA